MYNTFVPRLKSPDVNNMYYRHTGYYVDNIEGVNECLLINSSTGEVMPNCVGYAWGRFYEIMGSRPNLSRGNAQLWYGNTQDGYKRSQNIPLVPEKRYEYLGAVACFEGGNIGGHVNIIEQIYVYEGINRITCVTSNSYYGSTYFVRELLEKRGDDIWRRYNYSTRREITGYTFQGFILNPYMEGIPEISKLFMYSTRII